MRINVSERTNEWEKLAPEHTNIIDKREPRETLFNALNAL